MQQVHRLAEVLLQGGQGLKKEEQVSQDEVKAAILFLAKAKGVVSKIVNNTAPLPEVPAMRRDYASSINGLSELIAWNTGELLAKFSGPHAAPTRHEADAIDKEEMNTLAEIAARGTMIAPPPLGHDALEDGPETDDKIFTR